MSWGEILPEYIFKFNDISEIEAEPITKGLDKLRTIFTKNSKNWFDNVTNHLILTEVVDQIKGKTLKFHINKIEGKEHYRGNYRTVTLTKGGYKHCSCFYSFHGQSRQYTLCSHIAVCLLIVYYFEAKGEDVYEFEKKLENNECGFYPDRVHKWLSEVDDNGKITARCMGCQNNKGVEGIVETAA